MKNLMTAFFVFTIAICFSQEVQKKQISSSEVDAIFSKWDTANKPGIAVGILNDGEVVYAKGFGQANLEHQIPITPETKFHIGDLSKEFTVYAILLLEQQGKLSVQDDIWKYMPNEQSFPQAISIQQLIHHSSGLNNDEVTKALAGWKSQDEFTKEEAYAMIRNQAKSFSENERVQRPTETGFMILEDLISNISKMSYSDFVTKEIFQPLGMTNSVYDTQGNIITNKAQGYFAQKDQFINSNFNHKHTILADLYTTIGDMCLWAKELRDPKVGTKQMAQKFDALSVVNNKAVTETNMALYTGGHRFWNFRGAKKLYHVEVAGGYASKLIRYPDYDLAVVVMGNDGAYNGSAATGASELYIEPFLETSSNETAEYSSIKLSNAELAAFEGNYWDVELYSSRKIYLANDSLRYYRGPGNESPLVPQTNESFKMITRGEVNVSFDTKAVPKTMSVTVGDNTFELISYDTEASWAKNLTAFAGKYSSSTLSTSYSLSIDQDKLLLKHPRLESVELSPKIKDVFSGDRRNYSSLTFKRNASGVITGFKLGTSGVDDIWFQKENISQDKLVKFQ